MVWCPPYTYSLAVDQIFCRGRIALIVSWVCLNPYPVIWRLGNIVEIIRAPSTLAKLVATVATKLIFSGDLGATLGTKLLPGG